MLLLNFSHPLTDAHLAQLAELLGEPPAAPIGRMAQFDVGHKWSFDDQSHNQTVQEIPHD